MSEFTIYDGGLPHKEWNAVLDRYLIENTMEADKYAQLSPAQRRIIQEIKKSLKRITYEKPSK